MPVDIIGNKFHLTTFQNLVFNSAADGKLYKLKVFLDHKSKKEVEACVLAYTNCATPLVMACRNGHLDVAIYLIERCHANVEQVGSVKFDTVSIDGASPLWCAAAAGHLNIVKLLVRHNASVNSTTRMNSTPLRAACFGGYFEIVQYLIQHGADIEIANSFGHTSLMISCSKGHYEISKYLLDCGADFNRKNEKGNSALHDCAKSGHVEILKMLLKRGATVHPNASGLTPLLSAAIKGHASIVEYIIKEFNCTKQEKVEALELLGATFIDKKCDMETAVEFWKQAIYLRYEDIPLEKPPESRIASYVDVTEVCTFYQLEELIPDPDKMKMQCLLIRDRILGPSHKETMHYIRYRGATFADCGNFKTCFALWMYALDVQQQLQEPLSPVTQNSFIAFVQLFSYMFNETRVELLNRFRPELFCHILRVFKSSVTEIETALRMSQLQDQDLTHTSEYPCILFIAMYLIGLMCKLRPNVDQSEEAALRRAVSYLVYLNPKAKNGLSLLHLASFKNWSAVIERCPVFTFPSPEVVEILLEVGACVNALDLHKNTPLHVAAKNKPFVKTVFMLLLDHGSHLDFRNSDNKTPLQLASAATLSDICPLQYTSLKCLCAQAIDAYSIPYKGLLHRELYEFVNCHCSK